MLKTIKIDLTGVESLLFFWQLILEKEKVSELYILRVTELPPFKASYTEDFTHISLRRVLSAISNREVFIGENKEQGRFWSNNLWMLEDIAYITSLVAPLKRFNASDLIPKINKEVPHGIYDSIEIFFVPLHLQTTFTDKNKLYINFFAIIPLDDDKPTIDMNKLRQLIIDACIKIEKNA